MAVAFAANAYGIVGPGLAYPESSTTLLWIYPTALTTGRRLTNQSGTGYSHDLNVDFATSSEIGAEVVRTGGSDILTTSDAGITANKWWCVALTDDSSDGARVFVGDLATKMRQCSYSSRSVGGGTVLTPTGDLGFGYGNIPSVPASNFFTGRIAFVGRWRRRMTIGELWQQQFAPHPDADCEIYIWPGLLQNTTPAFAFDAGSESHTGTTGSANEGSFQWNHGGAAEGVRGVLVFTFVNANANDATAVTYGGRSMTLVGRAVDTAGEPGDCKVWFLTGDDLPQGTQIVAVTRNNNANVMYAVAATLVGAYPMEAGNPTLQQTDGTLTEVALNSGVQAAIRFAGINSGLAAIVDNPATPGANNLSRGASSTEIASIDFGARVIQVVRETTGGSGSRSVGFSATTSDDRAAAYLAIAQKIRDPNLAPLAGGFHGRLVGGSVAPNVPLWLPFGVERGVVGSA